MSKKLVIICNDHTHADQFVIKPWRLRPSDCIIITPETTNKMHGLKDIGYFALRPLYAREKLYVDVHGWYEVTRKQMEARRG